MNKQKDFKWHYEDFEWRYQPTEQSVIADVLCYIQNRDLHPSQTKTEMMLKALTAFYTSDALSGKDNRPEHLLAVKNALHILFQQLMRACAEWQIDPSAIVGSAFNSVSSFPKQQSEESASYEDSEAESNVMSWNLSGMSLHEKTYS